MQDQPRSSIVVPIRSRALAISALGVVGFVAAIYIAAVPGRDDIGVAPPQAETNPSAPVQRQAEPATGAAQSAELSPQRPATGSQTTPASNKPEPGPGLTPPDTETAFTEASPPDERREAVVTATDQPFAGRDGSITRSATFKTDWLQGVWEPRPFRHVVAVGRGDTLMGLLVRAGVDRGEAHQAITTLRTVFDPRRLRPGQGLGLRFFPEISGDRFLGISLELEAGRTIEVARGGGGFTAREIQRELSRESVRSDGRIDSSLYAAGIASDVPPTVMVDLIHIFSFDVDFQRDIRTGDNFEIMYERFRDRGKQVARNGEVLYASLTLSGRRYRLWRHKSADGRVDYYNEKGHSVRKALMRTPVDGARLSSGFGMRRHPVLGYSRMHRGTDFAAPPGTPIYAAGDGTVEKAGRWGAYGNYVRIRHNGTYKTAYAHMRGFARGIRAGKRVRQGQTIGYVGTTGRSTGPHLHYEVMRNGRQINSRTMRLPSGRKLKGKALAAFLTERKNSEAQFAALGADSRPAAGATESALAEQAGSCSSGAVGADVNATAC